MSTIRNLDEAQAVLNTFVPSAKDGQRAYTLERIRLLMEKLGNPQDSYQIVHVAGTSGKTSTAYFISSLLTTADIKVGLTVSPHIDQINERVQINLEPLAEPIFCSQLEKFLELVAASSIVPTYFELLVAFAYWQFAEEKVDYAVVEVGLGGLLDGTNVINRSDKVCVITDIGLDHTEVLGNTLPEIAAQKAGIIQPGNAVFMHQQSDDVMDVVHDVCVRQEAALHGLPSPLGQNTALQLPFFQQRNWNLAFNVYEYLCARDSLAELSARELGQAAEVYIPARMEIVPYKGKLIIMDGAHNAQKLNMLFDSIAKQYPGQAIAALVSLKQTRGIRTQSSLEVVTKNADWLGITSFAGSQDTPYTSVEPLEIAEACQKLGYPNYQVIADPNQAFKKLLARPEPILLITGSFYLLNHIRPHIKRIIKT